MTPDDKQQAQRFASRATEIAALAAAVANTLNDSADTITSGYAVEGLGTLATLLGSDLIDFAE